MSCQGAELDTHKWIEDVGPQGRTSGAAKATLAVRFEAVERLLPLAALHFEQDVEFVHQLRVATRRAEAAIEFYADLLPVRRRRWLLRQLGHIRRAAGEARDCDVMIHRWKADPNASAALLSRARRRRRRAQGPLIEIHQRLSKRGRLHRRVVALMNRIRMTTAEPEASFVDWARDHLRPVVSDFFDASRLSIETFKHLHSLRINCKSLRYAMELVGTAFPPSFRTEIYPALDKLQTQLGWINDLEVAEDRLRRRIEGRPMVGAGDQAHFLHASERARLRAARAEVLDWWSPQRSDELEERFTDLLCASARDEGDGQPPYHQPGSHQIQHFSHS